MKKFIPKYILVPLFFFSACSTEKNTVLSRYYHNLTSNYNIYFNGNESFVAGIDKLENNYQDNFSKLLPLFYYQDPSTVQTVNSDMDRAIEKATKVISLHSITAKPDLKRGAQTEKQKAFYRKKEYNKWIDDNYILMAKAYIYKNQHRVAIETLRKMISDFPEEETRFEGMIWLARAFIEMDDFLEAERLLVALNAEENLPEKYLADLYTSYADFHIQQENTELAIPWLEKAIDKTRKKHYRIRYTYLLAQIYQANQNPSKAVENYQKLVRMNPPYEMTFNSKINMARSFEAGSSDGDEIKELLRKMLKDDKNIDFQDQIYFALGEIAFKENNLEEAIAMYKESALRSTSNYNQKGLSYLALGDIYYNVPEYTLAQAYYDSSLQNIDKDYEDYEQLSLKGNSLNSLVQHVMVYEFEDSVQNLSRLPEDELFTVIDQIIEEVKKKEEEDKLRQEEERLDRSFGMTTSGNSRSGGQQAAGEWYFYNMNAKSFGQPEFRMKWGNRKLEDNWRRKNKQSIEIINPETETVEGDSAKSETTKILSNKNREFYLKDIPFSDSALDISNEKLVEALYNMGLVYRNMLKDNTEATAAFKEVIDRYPDNDYALLSAYNLYEIYNSQGNNAESNVYKNFIISNFPDTPRARILADPEYVRQLTEEQNRVNRFYEESYQLFQEERYREVIQNVEYALEEFKDHKIIPKYKLLSAISKGKIGNETTMTSELETIIEQYPGTEESEFARNLIEAVYNESPEVKLADQAEKAEEIYSWDSTGVFYIGLATREQEDINQLRFNLINFNLDNFNRLNLGLLSEEIGDYQVIFVTSFDKLFMAERYLESCANDREQLFRDVNRDEVFVFYITEPNYQILKEDKEFIKYRVFFERYFKK